MRDSTSDEERVEELIKQCKTDPTSVPTDELRSVLRSTDGETVQKVGAVFVRLAETAPLKAAEASESAWAATTTDGPKVCKIIAVGMCRICENHPHEIESIRDDIPHLLDDLTAELDSFDLFTAPERTPTETFTALAAVIELAYHFEQNDIRILPEIVDTIAQFLSVRCTPKLRQLTLTAIDLLGKCSVE